MVLLLLLLSHWYVYILVLSSTDAGSAYAQSLPTASPVPISSSTALFTPTDCCGLYLDAAVSSRSAIECINATVSDYFYDSGRNFDSVTAHGSEEKEEQEEEEFLANTGPSLSVVLVTRITPEVYDYGACSYFITATYAQTRNYALLPLWEDSKEPDYKYHRKLVPILDVLLQGKQHNQRNQQSEVKEVKSKWGDNVPDYVVWMDADLVVLDFNFRVERIAAEYPEAHILMSKDVSSLANTGMIIVRNTIWAKRFLRSWLSKSSDPAVFNEQIGFEATMKDLIDSEESGSSRGSNSSSSVLKKVKILPSHVLNSIQPPMLMQQPHHQILHLAAESNALRANILCYGVRGLCEASSSVSAAAAAAALVAGANTSSETSAGMGNNNNNNNNNNREGSIPTPNTIVVSEQEKDRRDDHRDYHDYHHHHQQQRHNIFSERYDELMNHTPPQLGLTRSHLLQSSIRNYKEEYENLQSLLSSSSIASHSVSIDDVARYRTAVSKYCYALRYANEDVESHETFAVRMKAVDVVSKILFTYLAALHNPFAVWHDSCGNGQRTSSVVFEEGAKISPRRYIHIGDDAEADDLPMSALQDLLESTANFKTDMAYILSQCGSNYFSFGSECSQTCKDIRQDVSLLRRYWSDVPELAKVFMELSNEAVLLLDEVYPLSSDMADSSQRCNGLCEKDKEQKEEKEENELEEEKRESVSTLAAGKLNIDIDDGNPVGDYQLIDDNYYWYDKTKESIHDRSYRRLLYNVGFGISILNAVVHASQQNIVAEVLIDISLRNAQFQYEHYGVLGAYQSFLTVFEYVDIDDRASSSFYSDIDGSLHSSSPLSRKQLELEEMILDEREVVYQKCMAVGNLEYDGYSEHDNIERETPRKSMETEAYCNRVVFVCRTMQETHNELLSKHTLRQQLQDHNRKEAHKKVSFDQLSSRSQALVKQAFHYLKSIQGDIASLH